jgi:hypothetical protein
MGMVEGWWAGWLPCLPILSAQALAGCVALTAGSQVHAATPAPTCILGVREQGR